MKRANTHSISLAVASSFVLIFSAPIATFAATTPSLGAASTYAILGSTYTNTTAGTTINGDIGFTTGPAISPLGTHQNYGSGVPYPDAGTGQANALSALASQPCTFTFAPGAINLSTDTAHGAIGTYTPGVYCSAGAMNIGGPLTLNGNGTFIFRPDGALTSTAGAIVTLVDASACDVFWTPVQAITLAANTTFIGTVIANAGVTVGANTNWLGRSLAFGGTVTTDTNTITAPACAATPPPSIPTPIDVAPAPILTTPILTTLHIIKIVVNGTGGTALASDFTLHVTNSGIDVTGSPAIGISTPGTSYSLSAGTYVVSEDTNISYTQAFSGDCDSNGSVTLSVGADKACTVTNTHMQYWHLSRLQRQHHPLWSPSLLQSHRHSL